MGLAIMRRYGPRKWRPYRIAVKSRPEHMVINGVLTAIGITGFGAEAFRIAEQGLPEYEKWSVIGYPLATLIDGSDSLSGWHQAWWAAHVLTFIAFLVIIPGTMLRHMFTSPLNMYLAPRERPKGAMKAMPDLESTELETFGASTIGSFTWKQLLDTDACTMCGRCTSVCPANATGKPLDPREIVLKTGEVMARTGSPAVSLRSASTPRSRLGPTGSSSASHPKRFGPAPRARRATRSARSTSRSSTRSSTCGATSRSWRATSQPSWVRPSARWKTRPTHGP
ncbi:MAG: 4Fe-4S binding protein [Acidimicrobiales bacterium]